jgi:hypothetical protein
LKTKATQFCSTNARRNFSSRHFKIKLAFADSNKIEKSVLTDFFVDPRLVTPWSTNAVEITQNMAISGIIN